MVTDESAYPEYNQKNEKWEDFAVVAVSQGHREGVWGSTSKLKWWVEALAQIYPKP